MIVSKRGVISFLSSSILSIAYPSLADAKTNGQSSCSSDASRSMKSSRTSSITSSGLASGRSILFTHTTIGSFKARAFITTNFVCGITPSKASTTRITPFTILRTRSTSPPKSACPGVSIIFILMSLYCTAVFLERIVIPLSFSMSLESMTRS